MRALPPVLATCAFVVLIRVGPVIAQESGAYASIFGGGNFLHDSDFVLRSSAPDITKFSQLDGTMHFNAGAIAGGAFGYRWNSLALEAELSGRRGQFDREDLPFGTIPLDGHYDAVSLMANAYYRFPSVGSIVPYVGAGAGVAFLSAEVIPPEGPQNNLSDTRAAFQAIAGVSVPLGSKAELGFEYRYFATDRPSYTVNIGGAATGSADVGFNSSNALVRLNWKFD